MQAGDKGESGCRQATRVRATRARAGAGGYEQPLKDSPFLLFGKIVEGCDRSSGNARCVSSEAVGVV